MSTIDTIVRAAGVVWLLGGVATASAQPGATTGSSCDASQARKDVGSVYDGARQRLRREGEPPKLEKDKVGHVLVARPAPTPADAEALRADLEQLARTLEKSPGSACEEALRVKRKHRL